MFYFVKCFFIENCACAIFHYSKANCVDILQIVIYVIYVVNTSGNLQPGP